MDIKDKDIEELIKNITEDRKKDNFQKKDISPLETIRKTFNMIMRKIFMSQEIFMKISKNILQI